jgi:hypothetical protein
MKENSSKDNMLDIEFELLGKAPKFKAPDELYQRILTKVDNQRNVKVSYLKVAIAACLILTLSVFEYSILKKSSQDDIHEFEVTLLNNNHLYHE